MHHFVLHSPTTSQVDTALSPAICRDYPFRVSCRFGRTRQYYRSDGRYIDSDGPWYVNGHGVYPFDLSHVSLSSQIVRYTSPDHVYGEERLMKDRVLRVDHVHVA